MAVYGESVRLGAKPLEVHDQRFFQTNPWGCSPYVTSSLTRRWVSRLQLLLALASAVIFGSESRGTRDHILLSQIWDFPFRRLLRLAGLRWRYSTPPPLMLRSRVALIIPRHGPRRKPLLSTVLPLLSFNSLPRKRVYRAVASKQVWSNSLSRGHWMITTVFQALQFMPRANMPQYITRISINWVSIPSFSR
jgi:hypothetical protein